MGGLRPKSTAEGGIGGAVGDRQSVIGLRFVALPACAAFKSGRAASATVWKRSSGIDAVREIEAAVDVELVHRRAVVEQHEQRDLGGPQIHLRGLIVRFVLDALQVMRSDPGAQYRRR